MIFDHRIWKEFGVEVGEGTDMRSVKSVMEHNHVADQIDKWEKVQLWIYIYKDLGFIYIKSWDQQNYLVIRGFCYI